MRHRRLGLSLLAVSLLVLLARAQLPPSPSQLAHISGSSRKIRMYVKNFYLSLGLDGRVSGLTDDTATQTVLQRSSVTMGKVKIQGVTTCMYLCMNICGIPYASRDFSEECVFNEMIEENHYNSYSSAKYSNSRRTLYLGLNRKGQARRVLTRGGALGRQSTYARVLTTSVPSPPRPGVCPPSSARNPQITRCRGRRRPRWKKRKRCREEEGCPLLRKRRPRPREPGEDKMARRIRHRKHRTAPDYELFFDEQKELLGHDEEMLEDMEEEDVTMTVEEEDAEDSSE